MEVFESFTLLFVSTILLLLFWWRSKFNYWKNRNVETTPISYIWGSLKDIFLQKEHLAIGTQKIYNDAKSKGLNLVGLYLFWSPLFIPIDMGLLKSIMQVEFSHFMDRGVYYNEKDDPLSAHLFSLEGKKWQLLRKKLTPTFSSGKMKMMFGTLLECTKGLKKVMDHQIGTTVDIKDILGRYTMDVIGNCAFGINCNSLENPNDEFTEKAKWLFHKTFWESLKDIWTFLAPDLTKKLNLKVLPKRISSFFLGVVENAVEYRERKGITRQDFLQLLIQLKNKGKLTDDDKLTGELITDEENTITLNEIAAQAFIFFEAGFESSSTTMTFALYELAKNKEIQELARQEIKEVLERYNGKLTYDSVMEMQYLEKIVKETLRMHPPFPMLKRICTKDYKVPGTDLVLEKGVRLMIPVYGVQRDPEFYPDPERFDPERFSEENRTNFKSFTFLTFGEGPRNCIGERFGILQTKVGLASLLMDYAFDISEKTREPIEYDPKSFVLVNKGGIWLTYRKID